MAHIENHAQAINNCGTAQAPAPLTEPVIVTNVFIAGAALAVMETTVQLVGWDQIPAIEGEPGERRIVTRLVMSTDTAREFSATLRNALTKGGH